MKNIYKVTIMVCCCCFGTTINSQQIIEFVNASFEDIPRKGGEFSNSVMGWLDCGINLFPGESPPDIHPVPGSAWAVSMPAAHGETYIGLVVRYNDTYESVSQRLEDHLIQGKCYSLSAFLARSPQYKSATARNKLLLENFTKPVVLQIYAGSEHCDKAQLLGESIPVEHEDWQRYDFEFQVNSSYDHITLTAFYDLPVIEAYNGHVMVDGLSSIVEVECK